MNIKKALIITILFLSINYLFALVIGGGPPRHPFFLELSLAIFICLVILYHIEGGANPLKVAGLGTLAIMVVGLILSLTLYHSPDSTIGWGMILTKIPYVAILWMDTLPLYLSIIIYERFIE